MTKGNSDRTHRNTLPNVTGAMRQLPDSRPTRIACVFLFGLFILLQPFTHWHEMSGAVHSHASDEHGSGCRPEPAPAHPHHDDGDHEATCCTHGDDDAIPLEIVAHLPVLPDHPELAADRVSPVCLPAITGRWCRLACVFETDTSPDTPRPKPARAPPAPPA